MNGNDFSITAFLEKIRDGFEVDSTRLRHFILHLAEFPDEQIVAFLAHAYHRPLNEKNKVDLTLAMRDSGTTLDWTGVERIIVDKHSTGGVGDKITIAMAPLVAALGFGMPTITGRGLGFSGGTLDKLAAIPGLSTHLSPRELVAMVKKFGFALGEQTAEVAPADKKLYALRDITATVPSIPLITASILSKKLAENLSALVLDVKWGSGAFMQTLADAQKLARSLVSTANGAGTKTRALITSMNQPLGLYSGNWCEIAEAVQILKDPRKSQNIYPDTYELLIALTTQLLLMTGQSQNQNAAKEKIQSVLFSGKAFEIFCQLIAHQSGQAKIFEKDFPLLQAARHSIKITAKQDGFIQKINTKSLGEALVLSHAGRQKQTDDVAANTALHHPLKVGKAVAAGDILCTLHSDHVEHERQIAFLLENAFTIGDAAPSTLTLIEEVIQNEY